MGFLSVTGFLPCPFLGLGPYLVLLLGYHIKETKSSLFIVYRLKKPECGGHGGVDHIYPLQIFFIVVQNPIVSQFKQ